MNKQVRDWQEDMELCEEMLMNNLKASRAVLAETPEMPMYWIKQSAEWKAKAYEAEVKAHEAEAREKKLREAIEEAIADIDHEAFRTACNGLEDALASLYPKEETK